MKLYAFSQNGMKQITITEIVKISVWLNKKLNHLVNSETLEALKEETKSSGILTIYTNGFSKGEIDAFPNPLYIHDVEEVYFISDDMGNEIWSKPNSKNYKLAELATYFLNFDSDDYNEIEVLKSKINSIGFDFDYDLNGQIFNLTRI